MKEWEWKDLFPSLKEVATSVVFKGVDLSFEFAEKLWKCKSKIVLLVNSLLDWKTYIPKKKKESFWKEMSNIIIPVNYEVDREMNFIVSTELKEELQDFIDFNQDYLNEELVKQLNKIFNGKFCKYDILNSMTSDLDENHEVYEELLEIIDKIDDEIKKENK